MDLPKPRTTNTILKGINVTCDQTTGERNVEKILDVSVVGVAHASHVHDFEKSTKKFTNGRKTQPTVRIFNLTNNYYK